MAQSNSMNFLRTDPFPKNSGDRKIVLSTISSAGSIEDSDGNVTDIDERPLSAKIKHGDGEGRREPAAAGGDGPATAAPRSFFGFLQPFARRSTASSSRSSAASSAGLSTIAEVLSLLPDREGNVTPIAAEAAVAAVSPPSGVGISDAETITPCQDASARVHGAATTATAARGSVSSNPRSNASQITLPVGIGFDGADVGLPEKPAAAFLPPESGSLSRKKGQSVSSDPLSGFDWDMSRGQQAKGFVTRWFVEWWLLEIISWTFSCICMAIILSVLLHYNGRTLPNWKLGLTLNSFISILSGFAKASLLLPTAEALGQLKWSWFRKPRKLLDFEVIDSASRGPWGSMLLLANTKGVTLVSIGAAIILLSLPLDLFFQQIVSYPTVLVKTGNASIPRAIYYDPAPNYQHNAELNDLYPNQRSLSADNIMYAAVTPYTWQNPYSGQAVLNVTCPTAHCTWEPFNTLSVCSKCVETPNLLEFGCYLTPNSWLNDTNTYPWSAEEKEGYTNIPSCGWYLNPTNGGPPILMSGYSVANSTTNYSSFHSQVLFGRAEPLRDIFNRQTIFDGRSINFPEIINPIVDFVTSGTPGGIEGARNNATPIVTECVLYWCVDTISAALIDSTLYENVTNSVQVPSTFPTNPWLDPISSWYQSMFSLVLPDSQVPGGYANFSVNNVTARFTYQALEDMVPHSWLQGFQVLPAEAHVAPGAAYVKWQWRQTNTISLQMSYVNATEWIPPGNVTKMVTSMAHDMSISLRRSSIGFTSVIPQWQGDAFMEQTRVHIRWPWIILPACLLVFSFVFLAVTIVRSEKGDKKKIGIWKSSALAILFNGLGEDVQDQVGATMNLQAARERARQLQVHLDD